MQTASIFDKVVEIIFLEKLYPLQNILSHFFNIKFEKKNKKKSYFQSICIIIQFDPK